jgi:glyoxylase-like metal-dependent hydrolase (beta-lactamase superfamily II)
VIGSWQYIVANPSSKAAAVIDPVLNCDWAVGTITTESADGLLSIIKEQQYKVDLILETHAHADHITAASYLKSRLASEQGDLDTPIICIGTRINQVQKC